MESLPILPTPTTIAFKVKSSVEKIIQQGHPWVFEKAIVKQNKAGKAGDIAIVFKQKNNQVLAIGLYDPFSVIRIKILTRGKATINQQWLDERIQKAYQKRLPLFQTDTNSYRLIHGENDGLPSLIIDQYAGVTVVKLYSLIWLPYLQWMLESIASITNSQVVVLRLSRQLQKLKEALYGLYDGQIISGQLNHPIVRFKEHGLTFQTDVLKGHKTGYFLDHRHNRKRIGDLSNNKKVLDVFAYVGGFSVHALAGGAKEVVSLDISKHALKMATKNVALNTQQARHSILAADAFKGLEQLYKERSFFDVVIVDPPAFAKKAAEVPIALKKYAHLAKAAIKLVRPNGILFMASCSSRVTADMFYQTILDALKSSKKQIRELERIQHDIDHPIGFEEGAYLKSIYFSVLRD